MTARRAESQANSIIINDWEKDIPGSLDEEHKVFLFPLIVGTTAHGSRSEWLIAVSLLGTRKRNGKPDVEETIPITPKIAQNGKIEPEDIAPYVSIRARIRVYTRVGDGQVSKRVPTYITTGRNIGRANETNVYCQALREALGKYNKHRRSCENPNETTGVPRPLPMLAKDFNKIYPEGHKRDAMPHPVFLQHKYDGIRTVGTIDNDEGILYGRKGLLFNGFTTLKDDVYEICSAWKQEGEYQRDAKSDAEHPTEYPGEAIFLGRIPKISGSLYLDGELYKHGMDLAQISGIARRADTNAEQDDLQMMVYDAFIVNEPPANIDDENDAVIESSTMYFSDRLAILYAIRDYLAKKRESKIIIAQTYVCDAPTGAETYAKIMQLYNEFLKDGYEGAIVRINAPYMHSMNDAHSNVLLKLKPCFDKEYPIVGWTTAEKGIANGALLFICEVRKPDAAPIRFTITPTGSLEQRREMAKEFARIEENGKTVFDNKWREKNLIVYFDDLSKDDVPQRARTAGIIREFA